MAVRTTLDIPEPLHDKLRQRAASANTSIRSLVISAIEQTYGKPTRGHRVKLPLITGKGKRGPRFPVDENPHDLILP
jgi:hypothetical protein